MNTTPSADKTNMKGLTIDGSTSLDLDDAFWLETVKDTDTTLLHISITDVGESIKPNSALDQQAHRKCFTRYLSDSTKPMLPHAYSEDSLSLLENKKRPAITLSIAIDPQGNTATPLIQKTYVKNKAKLNYKEAEQIMRSADHPFHAVLNKAHHIAKALFDKRKREGAITLYDQKKGITTSEDGILTLLSADESYNSHIIIQEFMILFNQSIAHFFAENDIPGLYRNHTSKAVAPERDVLLNDMNNVINMGDVARLKTLVNKFTLIFNKASYDPVIEGHYALNLPVYMHITSPIRRYADLINIRQLSAFLTQEAYPYSTQQLKTIGEHINTVISDYQTAKSSFFKEQAHEKNVERLNNTDDFSAIEGDDFYVLLKTAIHRNTLPESLHNKLISHLATHQLSVRELFVILFGAGKSEAWLALKTSVLASLSEHIHDATSLLTMAVQKYNWSPVKYQIEAIDQQPQAFCILAHTSIDGEDYCSDSQTTLPIPIKNKKLSEHLANFNLLCKILKIEQDIPIPSVDQQQETIINEEANTPLTNYVGKIIELCNEKGWSTIQYNYEQQGPSHQPVFSVRAQITIEDTHYCSEKIQGGNKKTLKQLASAALMSQISLLPSSCKTTSSANFIGMLNTLFQQKNLALPEYTFELAEEAGHGAFKCVCLTIQTDQSHQQTIAYGMSKKHAKQGAAEMMWQVLN